MSEKDSKRDVATAAPVVPAAAADRRTPEEWAGQCGQRRAKSFEETVSFVNGKPFDAPTEFLWQHESAAILHGWALHAHHAGEPMKLSRQDYEAALKAAGET